ncbi:glycosyltransferase family 2 protein [Nitrospira calida]|jgi:cellulose synthase/poly-beta-1,6-N-acetylglucosamine synthase-like glycosyltransferase
MTTLAIIAAWTAFGLVGYVYFGYPLALWCLARLRPQAVSFDAMTPSITLVISAYNEEQAIKPKLENTLRLDYPRDKLQVIVVSDASTDNTDRIVRSFEDQGVILLRMPIRGGKTVGLNAALTLARGDIVVFSDANILYRPDTLRNLVKGFADPSVGCVTGDSRYLDEGQSAADRQENAYWGYERMIRLWESQVGSTVGGDGAIFAIRRELYTPLAPEAINDLVIPLQIVAKGYRAIYEPTAVGYESAAGDFWKEFRRKRRIVNRSWRGIMSVADVLKPWRVGMFAWQVWSHKILRWLVLPLIMIAVVGCLVAAQDGWVYRVGLLGFALSVGLAGMGAVVPDQDGIGARIAQGMFYFYLVNLAAVLGIARAIRGDVEMVWTPERP